MESSKMYRMEDNGLEAEEDNRWVEWVAKVTLRGERREQESRRQQRADAARTSL